MHFKQAYPYGHYLDEHKHRNHSHYYHQTSLEQSPISQFREDSDHSDEHFLYPQSLKPAHKIYDIKANIIELLAKLQMWLQELTLTQNCIHQIQEQLQPIIQQLQQLTQEESTDSYWFSLPKPLSSLKANPHCHLSKDAGQPYRNKSILIHESSLKEEVWLISEPQKNLIKIFFKKYSRLLSNTLLKINKYSIQTKIKFLLQTNLRNIFTETLRISYELKLIEHQLKQSKQAKYNANRSSFIHLLSHRIQCTLNDKGHIAKAFRSLKKMYYEQTKQDSLLVTSMNHSLKKLHAIYQRNHQQQLQSYTYKWRESAFHLKVQEELAFVDWIKGKIDNILNTLIDFKQTVQDFKFHWRSLIQHNLNQLCYQLFQDEHCFYLNLQEILNQRYSKQEKQITLSAFLEDSRFPSHCNPTFLHELTIDQLRTCILSGQIHKNNTHNLLLVPLKPTSGVFFVQLQPQSCEERMPMRLSSFRSLLRIVQLITPILQTLVCICKRIELSWQQTDKKSYYQILFRQFLQPPQPQPQPQPHIQFLSSQGQIEIDSNRLQSSIQSINTILSNCNIQNLMIYHHASPSINDMPCIIYGDKQLPHSHRYILHSLYDELIASRKKVLTVSRNGNSFHVLPLEQSNRQKGLIYYTTKSAQKIDNQMLSECLIPLLLRSEGKMDCEQCKVSLKIPTITNFTKAQPQNQAPSLATSKPTLEQSLKLLTSSSLSDLQKQCACLLRSKGNFFLKMIYKLDLSELDHFYSISASGQVQQHLLKQSQRLTHSELFIQDYSSMLNCSLFAKITHSSPNFNNPQLHIYQHQNDSIFRLVALPIKNSHHYGYLLAGFYQQQQTPTEHYIQYLKSIVQCVTLNPLFTPTQINSPEMQRYCREHESKTNKQTQKFLQQIKPTKRGKLTQSLTHYSCFLQQKLKESQCTRSINITIFKLNTNTSKSKLLHSTKSFSSPSQIHFPSDILQFLLQNELILTHEQLLSNQCRIKQQTFNRTIKPINPNKINNIALFLPPTPTPSPQLIQRINQKYKLKGLIANQYYDVLSAIDRQINHQTEDISDNTYALFNFGNDSTHNQKYFAILQHSINQEQTFLNENTLRHLQNIYRSIYKQSQLHQQSLKCKATAIQQLQTLLRGKYTSSNCIKSFVDNFTTKKFNTAKIYKQLSRFIIHPNDKNYTYYSLLQSSFKTIKKANYAHLCRVNNFIQRIIPQIESISSKFLKVTAFSSIYTSIHSPTFPHQRALRKVTLFFNSKSHQIKKHSFPQIKHTSSIRHSNNTLNKQHSIFKTTRILTSIHRRQLYQYFMQQLRSAHLHFVNSLQLIAQQFNSIEFNTKDAFITFSNQRFDTLLQHIGFGIVNRIRIGVAQLCQSRLILHKPNESNQIQEYSTQAPLSFEPQLHNNFHFVPIPIAKPSSHFLIYQIKMSSDIKNSQMGNIVGNAITKGLVPSYQRYLQGQLERADKLCRALLNISCKQIWNGRVRQSQSIYIFSKGKNSEQQCLKLKALSRIKQSKRCQQISELKLIRNAINEQSKQYYRLEYEYNCINNALAYGLPSQPSREEEQLLTKYSELITKDQLREARDLTAKIEEEYESKNIQYQIKSKTYATNKIMVYYDKTEKKQTQSFTSSLLNQQNQHPNHNIEQAIVQTKMELASNRQRLKKVQKKQKTTSARAIYLILTNCRKKSSLSLREQAFKTILLPKESRLRA